jgi:Inhibitor of Apoptosis domain
MAAAVVHILFANEEFPYFTGESNIIKELAVVDISSFASQQWRFAIPRLENVMFDVDNFMWQKPDISGGDIAYERVYEILMNATDTYKVIFVHGSKILKTLRSLMNRTTIYDLQDLHSLNLDELPVIFGTECLHHFHEDESQRCAHAKAYRLADWCDKNWNKINMMEATARKHTFKNWAEEKICKTKLAYAGFTHAPSEDFENLTVCFYCGLKVHNWTEEDIPIIKHRIESKYCMLFNFCTLSGMDV